MRSKALIVLAVVVVALMVVLYLYRNRLVESGIEAAGTTVVGAKVEIDNLYLDLLHLTVRLKRLQVTNPNDTWRNLFEFGSTRFQLEAGPLLWNRFVVREISVADIRFNSPRESDGAVLGVESPKPSIFERAREGLMARLQQAPMYDLTRLLNRKVNVDSVLAVLEIGMVDSVEALQKKFDSTVSHWTGRISSLDPRPKLNEVENLVRSIRPAEIKRVDELVDALDRVNRARNVIVALKAEVDSVWRGVEVNLSGARAHIARVDDWMRADIQRARSKVGLPDLRPAAVAEMLFGRAVVERALVSIYWVGLARQVMPYVEKAEQVAKAGKVQKPPRKRGQNIIFPVKQRWPKWLIRRIFLSATSSTLDTSRGWRVSGEVTGLTSHPPVYGKPATFQLQTKVPGGRSFAFTGSLDHTEAVPVDQFELRAKGLRLGGVGLVEAPYFPNRLKLDRTEATLRFLLASEELDFGLEMVAPRALFEFSDVPKEDHRVAGFIREVFAGLDRLELQAGIRGEPSDLHLSVRSNLDAVLSNRLRSLVGAQIEAAQQEIERRLTKMAEEQRQRLLAWHGGKVEPLIARAQEYKRLVDERDRIVDDMRKELEKRVEEEKKKLESQLGEEARRKLKELIKKP